MNKYLIVECEPLNDPYECDANRTPIKVVDDYSEFNKRGYEIWKIEPNGNLTCIKNWEDSVDTGMALYYWENTKDISIIPPTIIQKETDYTRDDVTSSFCKKLKKKAKFKETVENIYNNIIDTGSHAEKVNNHWVVYGEYADDDYSIGY